MSKRRGHDAWLANPPESNGLHKKNFLATMNEEILNEVKQIH